MKAVIIVLMSCLFLGCEVEEETNDVTELYFDVAHEGVIYELIHPQYHMIGNSSDLSNVLAATSLTGLVLDTDFNNYRYVALFAIGGLCSDRTVESVYERDGSVVVNVVISTDPAVACLAVVASPYMVIEIENTSKPVSVNIKNE